MVPKWSQNGPKIKCISGSLNGACKDQLYIIFLTMLQGLGGWMVSEYYYWYWKPQMIGEKYYLNVFDAPSGMWTKDNLSVPMVENTRSRNKWKKESVMSQLKRDRMMFNNTVYQDVFIYEVISTASFASTRRNQEEFSFAE